MIAEVGGLGADGELMDVAADASQLREIVARQCDMGVARAQAVHLRRRDRAGVPVARTST